MGINPTNITQQYDVCGTVIHPMPIGITCFVDRFPGETLGFPHLFCVSENLWHQQKPDGAGQDGTVEYLVIVWFRKQGTSKISLRIMYPMILPQGQIYHSGLVIVMVCYGIFNLFNSYPRILSTHATSPHLLCHSMRPRLPRVWETDCRSWAALVTHGTQSLDFTVMAIMTRSWPVMAITSHGWSMIFFHELESRSICYSK